jgi:hypothetical protein
MAKLLFSYCPPHCPATDFAVFLAPASSGAVALPAQVSVPLMVLPMTSGASGDVVPETVAF